MNVLYVISRPIEINSSSSIRNRSIIKGLLSLGHSVDILTTEANKKQSSYDETLSLPNVDTLYVTRNNETLIEINKNNILLKNIRKEISMFLKKALVYDKYKRYTQKFINYPLEKNKYDLIISSSDPKSAHYIVKKLYEKQKIKNIPWFQIWGDPFSIDITNNSLKLVNLLKKKEEERLINSADKVFYVSKLTLRQQQQTFRENSFKMKSINVPYKEKKIYQEKKTNKNSITFLYSGGYNDKIRNILPLYNAIKKTNHKLIICGRSNLNLKETRNIKIYPRISLSEVEELEERSDILVHLSNVRGTQIPGKIFHYSGTNKPILFILDGEEETVKKEFKQYNRYIFTKNTEKYIHNTICNLSEEIIQKKYYPVREFSPATVASNIINEFIIKE